MLETTKDVSNTTKEVAETSEEIKEESKIIRGRTADLYLGSLEAFGEQIMNDRFELLKKANTTTEKLSHAVIIMAAMDYQNWQGEFDHDAPLREYLIDKNLEYLFSSLRRFSVDNLPIDPPVLRPKQFNNWKSLGALSVAMSKIHPNQKRMAEIQKFEPLSVFDIIAESLLHKSQLEAGGELPGSIRMVLENEPMAIYLLQLRHNIFKGSLLAAISDYEDGRADGLWNKVWFGFLAQSLEVEIKDFNSAQYDKWSDWLWKISTTQETLKNIGETLQETSMVVRAFRKVKFVENGQPINMQQYEDQEIDTLNPKAQGLNSKVHFFTRFVRIQNN